MSNHLSNRGARNKDGALSDVQIDINRIYLYSQVKMGDSNSCTNVSICVKNSAFTSKFPLQIC